MEQTFLKLVEQHRALLYKVCHTFESSSEGRKDMFQEIVLQLWRAFPGYDSRVKWSTWAYRIALNTAITQLRKQTRRKPEPAMTPQVTWERNPEEEALEELYVAISTLNDLEKALIHLYLDDVPYAEIASIIGITENNVGVKLNRIKTKLKALLRHDATK